MDEKISLKALEDYSDDYASKVTASFFSAKEKITGPEITKLCDIPQINFFIVRELLHAWKLESQKLRSPFFDYTAPAVAESLVKFQNLLSNNISITKENFQPLLKKATHQTLYLILDPYDFYADTLDNGSGGLLKLEDLTNEIKYIKINRTPLEKLVDHLRERKLTSLTGNEAFALLDHILEEVNFTPEDVEGYISRFSAVVPLTIEQLYEKKAPVAQVAVKNEPTPVPQPEKKPVPEKIVPEKEPARKPRHVQATLYDTLHKGGSQHTLADDFQKRRKIKDSLTINQKFMFTKILFNGDFELFSAAIERLDELDDMNQ
ncbi:MAG TPA: hypothetical protein VG737_10245, partial [Cyclobacteriaceae bacterium]|nr:hypothetical protein [Cyclobacteriaceae bacterium]